MALVSNQSSMAVITNKMMFEQITPISGPMHKPKEENHEVKSPDV